MGQCTLRGQSGLTGVAVSTASTLVNTVFVVSTCVFLLHRALLWFQFEP